MWLIWILGTWIVIEVKRVFELDLEDASLKQTGKRYLNLFTHAWELSIDGKKLVTAGIKEESLVGSGAMIWLVMERGVLPHMRELKAFFERALRRLVKVYGRVHGEVKAEFKVGQRFAREFGLREVGRYEVLGDTYVTYEVRQWL